MNDTHSSSSSDVPPAESYLSCPPLTSGDPWTTRVTKREERRGSGRTKQAERDVGKNEKRHVKGFEGKEGGKRMKGEKQKIQGEAAEHWARERERERLECRGCGGGREGRKEDNIRGNRE